ncbi:hypothetical protein FRC06_006229, partial [Ceratobasidium sp. 370]
WTKRRGCTLSPRNRFLLPQLDFLKNSSDTLCSCSITTPTRTLSTSLGFSAKCMPHILESETTCYCARSIATTISSTTPLQGLRAWRTFNGVRRSNLVSGRSSTRS